MPDRYGSSTPWLVAHLRTCLVLCFRRLPGWYFTAADPSQVRAHPGGQFNQVGPQLCAIIPTVAHYTS